MSVFVYVATITLAAFSTAILSVWPLPLHWQIEFQKGDTVPQWIISYPTEKLVGVFATAVMVTRTGDDVIVTPIDKSGSNYIIGFKCRVPGCGGWHIQGHSTLVENWDSGPAHLKSAITVGPGAAP